MLWIVKLRPSYTCKKILSKKPVLDLSQVQWLQVQNWAVQEQTCWGQKTHYTVPVNVCLLQLNDLTETQAEEISLGQEGKVLSRQSLLNSSLWSALRWQKLYPKRHWAYTGLATCKLIWEKSEGTPDSCACFCRILR